MRVRFGGALALGLSLAVCTWQPCAVLGPAPVAAQTPSTEARAQRDERRRRQLRKEKRQKRRRARVRARAAERSRMRAAESSRPAPSGFPDLVRSIPEFESAAESESESETETKFDFDFVADPYPESESESESESASPALASEPRPGDHVPQVRPRLQASRAKSAPEIDGVLDDPAWRAAVPATGFTQKAPFSGRGASEPTRVRVLYDDEALYVAFECEQRNSPISALLARRDRPLETDSVSIALDAHGDGRSAFEFTVSAAGTLIDGIRYDDGKIAREWDEIWEAGTAVGADRWTAELRIPLRALRFEAAHDARWGMQARRYISARQESDEWAYAPAHAGGVVSHFGSLAGLDVEPDQSLELRPFVLARAQHQQPDPALAGSGWELGASGGLDFSWHPDDSVALDGTINPDFAQVEADRLILNLGTSELLFPEKRPFFLAGMDDFATLTPIFYSRRIGRTPSLTATGSARPERRPEPSTLYGALKLAADATASTTVAALSAVTGPNQVDVIYDDGVRQARLLEPLSAYNALRVRSELVPRLDLGALATTTHRVEPNDEWPRWLTSDAGHPRVPPAADGSARQRCPDGVRQRLGRRCFHDAYVGSLDLAWRSPGGDYALRAQGYASAIANGPTRVLPDGTEIGAGDLGAGGSLRLSKQGGEHWLFDASGSAHSRKLDFNDLGFMDRQNVARAGAYAEYRTLEPWWVMLETHSAVLAYGENNLDGLALGRGALLMESLVLESGWTVTVGGHGMTARYDDREVYDGSALERAALLGVFQSIATDPRLPLMLELRLAAERPENGANYSAQLDAIWRPWPQAELQVTPSYSDNAGEPRYAGSGAAPGELVFGRLHARSAALLLRASYAFTPTLTLQSFAQLFLATGEYSDYSRFIAPVGEPRPVIALDSLAAGSAPAIRPDFQRTSLALNVVLRWEYTLGSTLYLLYARTQDPNIALDPAQAPRLDPAQLGTAPASDLLMLKLSYWIG